MKKLVLCKCGSGKYFEQCCDTNVRVLAIPNNGPHHQKEILTKLSIGREFGMRFRGVYEFYGNDLIEFKLKNPKSRSRNEFLRVLAQYVTEYLEDVCLSSWNEPDFWEEFIILYYPCFIQVTSQEKEVEKFVSELKRFLHWIDIKYKIPLFKTIDSYIKEMFLELKDCEATINRLYKHEFPNFLNEDCNIQTDFFGRLDKLEEFPEKKDTLFEIKSLNRVYLVVTELETNENFYLKGLPSATVYPGMIISGSIGRKKGDWAWTWGIPENVFPKSSKKYLDDIRL
ncbi:hypothetical protein DS745_23350 [Anaerobacillus alkaliphilus]|uniref:SEC-C domain-containing protein n=1 Tax=Anaerobacillus alkaliphilus TaxID=1548597 RepID=A0A4V1LFV8_9BACI|nr:hypothetical protein [Anaerobacillus alkaliphilus]RXI96639.1 hypothetical protein DS745_23350 [Anaerobacillus alkaliphilus]